MDRRSFLLASAAAIAAGATSWPALGQATGRYGPLQPPDGNGVRLPEGFSSRVVARSGDRVGDTTYRWHSRPDGGATFASGDGGWIYVANSEVPLVGGASAIRFTATGAVAAAYRILDGTSGNCAGGATPWGTWLSCEEHELGQVWECDPTGQTPAVARPALGRFTHEAAAVDPRDGRVYLTEDRHDGLLYRFTPRDMTVLNRETLAAGRLDAAVVDDAGHVTWRRVPSPEATVPLRRQVQGATTFARGEGAFFAHGIAWFVTTADNRVWAYDPTTARLRVAYAANADPGSPLSGADNITVAPNGDLLVAEDGGDMQLVVIQPDGTAAPLLQVVGHDGSETTGPAFTPAGDRLYFSSQRGTDGNGVTFEITGPFDVPAATTTTTTAPPVTSPTAPTTTIPLFPDGDDDGVPAWAAGAGAFLLGAAAAALVRLRNRGRPGGPPGGPAQGDG